MRKIFLKKKVNTSKQIKELENQIKILKDSLEAESESVEIYKDEYNKLSIKYDERDELQKGFINLLEENRNMYKNAAIDLKEEKDILIAKMENIKSYLFNLSDAINSGVANESIIASINEKINQINSMLKETEHHDD